MTHSLQHPPARRPGARLATALVSAASLLVATAGPTVPVSPVSAAAPARALACYSLEMSSLTGPAVLDPGGTGTITLTVENPNPAGACDEGMQVEITFNGTPHAISAIDGGPGIVCREGPPGPFAYTGRCLAASFDGGAVATIQYLLRHHGASLETDGEFGQQTRGLVVDGVVGPRTWAALVATD